ncbi:MAG: GGDEF domain-containing protein [Gemmatimonadaceae bacterium]
MPSLTALVFAPDARPLPAPIAAWLAAASFRAVEVRTAAELMAHALRGRPSAVVFDARDNASVAESACRRLKADSYTGVVPAVFIVGEPAAATADAFAASADEVLREPIEDDECAARLNAMMRRSERDVRVHPSTRLPGTDEIEKEIGRRLDEGSLFGVCYADLDYFKEFNDRYSYFDGDRVIRILARILHDVVKGLCGEGGFIGHIGGDDFIFIVPIRDVSEACQLVIEIFDAIVPYQYSEQDRRASYYFGKDRRGQLHRVPLMTVSIGVVTNERRNFSHPAQVSELATEMKSYAKTLPGSVFTVDRRHDGVDQPPQVGTAGERIVVGEGQ